MDATFLHELIIKMEKETQEIEAQIENYNQSDEDMMALFLAGKVMSHKSVIRELQHIFQEEKPIETKN